MTTTCPCGGRYKRFDIIALPTMLSTGRMIVEYHDADPTTAYWTCDKCHRVRKQRKRQGKKENATT